MTVITELEGEVNIGKLSPRLNHSMTMTELACVASGPIGWTDVTQAMTESAANVYHGRFSGKITTSVWLFSHYKHWKSAILSISASDLLQY